MSRYSILIEFDPEAEPGDCQYAVSVPALPGCFTQAHTIDEAIERAREAITVHVRGLAASGDPVPAEPVPLILATVDIEVPVTAAA